VLKQAAADPSALTQETIIDNLDQVERGRLARIRNIGIAVCTSVKVS
jgi:elongation factor G